MVYKSGSSKTSSKSPYAVHGLHNKKLQTLLVKLVIDDIYEDEPSLRENFHKNHNILAKIFYKVLTNFGLKLLFKTSWYLQISFNHEKNALLTHLVIVPCWKKKKCR